MSSMVSTILSFEQVTATFTFNPNCFHEDLQCREELLALSTGPRFNSEAFGCPA
jgi:hypothetical protein